MAGWTHRLRRSVRGLILAGTTGLGLWGLSQNPFAQPLVARSADAAARGLEVAFRDTFTPDWLADALAAALAAKRDDRVVWLAELAASEGLALPEPLRPEVARIQAEQASLWNNVKDCAQCALDTASCGSISDIAICAVPFELSPAGDVNALRRQGMAWLAGREVDGLETGLALVGMGATAAVLFSGGSSAAVKAGASTARMARRMGTLTPGLTRSLTDLADLPVDWAAALRRAPLDEITDTARLTRVGGLAADLGRVAQRAGVGETLILLRHIDGPEDAARMARLAEISGPRTLARVEVLGKARAFRAMARLSDMALATLAALYAAGLNILLMLLGRCLRR